MADDIRLSQGGVLGKSPQYPRIMLAGAPGMQCEVALTKEGYHGVITLLGGSAVAAVGFPPDGLRAIAQACELAARKIEQRHGAGESGLTIIEGDIT